MYSAFAVGDDRRDHLPVELRSIQFNTDLIVANVEIGQ